MTRRWIQAVAATTLLTTAVGSTGCGYFLHPERRGNQSGHVDGGTLVMDLLWLLPGIVPGVVALIVDFSSGAIYVNGRVAVRVAPTGRVAVQLPRSSEPMQLELRLVTASHRVLARRSAWVGPMIAAGQSLELELRDAVQRRAGDAGGTETVYLEIQPSRGSAARFPTALELAPAGGA